MPLDIHDVLDLLSTLCDESNLRVTVKESLKSGLIAGSATTIGGILGGPIGIAVGGSLGVAAATYLAKGKFKSVSQVLSDMSKDQKQKLYDQAVAILAGVSISDGIILAKVVLQDRQLKQELMGAVVNHVTNQLKLQIVD